MVMVAHGPNKMLKGLQNIWLQI